MKIKFALDFLTVLVVLLSKLNKSLCQCKCNGDKCVGGNCASNTQNHACLNDIFCEVM